MVEDDFETVQEAAERLELSESYTRKLCARGCLSCIKPATQWLVRRGAVPDSRDDGEPPELGYVTVREAAAMWQMDLSSVTRCCAQGRVPGAVLAPYRNWLIPKDAPRPRHQRHPRRSRLPSS